MARIESEWCDWAVNSLGNVLLAAPRFHVAQLDCALIEGGNLVFLHDNGKRTVVSVPPRILDCLLHVPTILLVAFDAGSNVTEVDLPVRRI